MKKIVYTFFFILIFHYSNAQDMQIAADDLIEYDKVDLRPEFPSTYASFMDFINKNFNLSDYDGPTGIMKATFIIEANGKISNIKLVKSLDAMAASEMKKVLAKCPAWKPGEHNGKPVRVMFEFSIKLQGNS